MGIDYYLINNTDREYIWLGRWCPVNRGTQLQQPVREEWLLDSIVNDYRPDLDGCLDWVEELRYTLTLIDHVIKYIKGKDCIVVSDSVRDLSEYIITPSYTNNEFMEDYIYSDLKSTFGDILR